jgi:site-specific DNA-methyltransferase (adenine-specific)
MCPINPDHPTMSKTKTSSFGVSKRERHDSSSFYSRNLYDESSEISTPIKELKKIYVPPRGDWADKIYCQTSENMGMIPDNSIGLAFTSPPYNVGKDYDDDMSLQDYLLLIENVAREIYRVLRPGGRYVVNIANLGRKPYIPINSFFYEIHSRVGFLSMGEIIWQKADGASGNCAWGSWRNAKSPRLRDIHEYLLVFAKQSFSRPDIGKTDISPTEFMDATLSVWNIQAESAIRVRHPAPFPIQLAERVIELYSYKDDVVLDPFVGSGTTCVAAENKNRHYVGFDISREYCDLAELRIKGKGKLYMPSEKTECSELSVAFGLLGISNPIAFTEQEIILHLDGSLSVARYERFKSEFSNPVNSKLYQQLIKLGSEIRTNYPLFNNLVTVKWCGPQKQARTDSGPRDILAANTSISIKAGSNIISNFSPAHIFESIPQGSATPDHSENWYLKMDPSGYQKLYSSVQQIRLDHFPQKVTEFERVASKNDRDELQSEISKLIDGEKEEFEKIYTDMSHKVAETSAALFNKNYSISMKGPARGWVVESVAKNLFRLDSTEYIMAGESGKNGYAIKMPSLSEWKREWEIIDILAMPDITRGQSVVLLDVKYKRKKESSEYHANFHIEVRWSHGKFSQSPEAKLYKDFNWGSIPFVERIV